MSEIGSPFSFKIRRNSSSEAIFQTSTSNLIFSEHYLELEVILPTPYLYGLGERTQGFIFNDGNYTIWAEDFSQVQ